MDSGALIASLRAAFADRQGVASLILQNHLYGCFIVMEDLAQGVLELAEGHLTGNALYLNLDTQFGHIGVRYYGFSMDGKAILVDLPPGYAEAWKELFVAAERTKDMMAVDRVEEEVMEVLEGVVHPSDRYFMNALEHEGNLSPDWVERALYLLHPHLESGSRQDESMTVRGREEARGPPPRKRGKEKGGQHERREGRGLSLTRRRGRGRDNTSSKFGATTRRRRGTKDVRESPPNLLEKGE